MTWLYPALFLSGWIAGVGGEYVFHWIMHRCSLQFHLNHHKEFFQLPPREVALRDLDPRLNIKVFALALIVASPLMLVWGWVPVLLVWGGAAWHLVIVYEACHAVLHYEEWLPRPLRNSRLFLWWKGCHIEHHRHAPAGNYCVTFPVLDWCLGTYVRPAPRAETPAEPAA